MLKRQLGTLKKLDPRDVWEREDHAFTPWLRDHIGYLADTLSLNLELVDSEIRVGSFAADIVAKEANSCRTVVIENQLESTDHSHLGQLIIYGAGLGARVFV